MPPHPDSVRETNGKNPGRDASCGFVGPRVMPSLLQGSFARLRGRERSVSARDLDRTIARDSHDQQHQ